MAKYCDYLTNPIIHLSVLFYLTFLHIKMMKQEGIHLIHKFSGRNWNNKKSTDKDITET